jgi:hypothetical protein
MALDAVWDGGLGTCHFAITSACNARCGFCSFARDKLPASSRHSATLAEAKLACDNLKRNGIGFVHFTGGEPLVHPDFTAMVAHAAQISMIDIGHEWRVADTAAGRRLGGGRPRVGLYFDRRFLVQGARLEPGPTRLSARIRRANAALKRHQIPSSASVTMSRVVDYPALPEALRDSRLWRGDIFLPLANASLLLSRLRRVAARRFRTRGAACLF